MEAAVRDALGPRGSDREGLEFVESGSSSVVVLAGEVAVRVARDTKLSSVGGVGEDSAEAAHVRASVVDEERFHSGGMSPGDVLVRIVADEQAVDRGHAKTRGQRLEGTRVRLLDPDSFGRTHHVDEVE